MIGLALSAVAIQMLVELGVQNPLGQRLLQLVDQPILIEYVLRIAASQKLVQQVFLDRHMMLHLLPIIMASHTRFLTVGSKSTVLSIEDEAVIVAFRRHTLLAAGRLPLCFAADDLPHLTRSSLHRCLQRHGISQLPAVEGTKPLKSKFKTYPIGFFHIDIAQVRTEQGKLHLFVAIDRTSKFAFIELHEKATTRVAADFLRHLIAAVPYKIHTVLTDNGIHFTTPGAGGSAVAQIKEAMAKGHLFRAHAFEFACAKNDIDHRLTKPKHPWTNGQVERMNRTIKEATVHRFHYESHQQLRHHLANFVTAYNFARRLKTLKGLTPYEYICKTSTAQPERFILDPLHQMPGLNI